MSNATQTAERQATTKEEVDPLLAGLDMVGEGIDALKRDNATLLSACKHVLQELEGMTTESFRRGGDRPIRDLLASVIAQVSR